MTDTTISLPAGGANRYSSGTAWRRDISERTRRSPSKSIWFHLSYRLPCSINASTMMYASQSWRNSKSWPGLTPRAFDEKVESMIGDSHDGANRIQDPHWDKGASDEWGSLIPTICVNVSLRQSKPVIPVRKLLSCTTWL